MEATRITPSNYINNTHSVQYLIQGDKIKRYSADILTYLKYSSSLGIPDVIRNSIREETLFTEQEYEVITKPSWEFDNQESLAQSYISISETLENFHSDIENLEERKNSNTVFNILQGKDSGKNNIESFLTSKNSQNRFSIIKGNIREIYSNREQKRKEIISLFQQGGNKKRIVKKFEEEQDYNGLVEILGLYKNLGFDVMLGYDIFIILKTNYRSDVFMKGLYIISDEVLREYFIKTIAKNGTDTDHNKCRGFLQGEELESFIKKLHL